MVVVKFLVFVSEVVSIFSKILTWIIGGAKGYLCTTNSISGGACPGCPPKSTPVVEVHALRFMLKKLRAQKTALNTDLAYVLSRHIHQRRNNLSGVIYTVDPTYRIQKQVNTTKTTICIQCQKNLCRNTQNGQSTC